MVNDIVLGQIQKLVLPKILTRSQLLDIYLGNYEGKDGTCKDVIEAAKNIGVKVIYKKLEIATAVQDDFKKPRKSFVSRKKDPTKRKYVDDPVKLIDLKRKYTYKKIGKIYNVNASKIFEDIKHYNRNVLGNTTPENQTT